MNRITTTTFSTTMKSLTLADSLMPRIRIAEMRQMMTTATRLMEPGCAANGEATKVRGRLIPKDCRMESKVAAQLTETVAAPTAYSRTSAQPIIQATSSPMVA